MAAFDRNLWYVPPPPVVPPPEPRPPELPRLDLLGIMHQGDGFSAMIIDQADNEIRRVSGGDRFGVTRVVAITESSVHCEAHGVAFELTLEGGRP